MKKFINTILLLSAMIMLFSCFGKENNEIENAKKELGIIEKDNTQNNETNNNSSTERDNSTEDKNTNEEVIEKPVEKIEVFEISNLTDNVFLEFDEFDENNILDGEIELTGKTLTNVDKIVVNFSNNTSDYPDDEFTLQKFKAGDDTFLYRAFSKFETLDFGKNEYIFTAYSGEQTSKLQLIINFKKEKDKRINILESMTIDDFPTGEEFGNPIDLGNGKITYSDFKGLEIGKIDNFIIDCGLNSKTNDYHVSEFLNNKIDSYYWWNTCRPIGKDLGISFYVISLDELGYKYEKQYILNNGIYGVYEIETGKNLVLENDTNNQKIAKLKEKNLEMKGKNENFQTIKKVDNLFSKLINN